MKSNLDQFAAFDANDDSILSVDDSLTFDDDDVAEVSVVGYDDAPLSLAGDATMVVIDLPEPPEFPDLTDVADMPDDTFFDGVPDAF